MGSLMNGEVLPRPSVHLVAHVFSLHGIVKLDSDYSEAGLIIYLLRGSIFPTEEECEFAVR